MPRPLDTGQLAVPDPEARPVMILQEVPSRGASMELQSDQPAPHSHHQRLRGPGPVAGAQGATTEPVVTALTRLAVAARDLEVVLGKIIKIHKNTFYGII